MCRGNLGHAFEFPAFMKYYKNIEKVEKENIRKFQIIPTNFYLFEPNNKNTRKKCVNTLKVSNKDTKKTLFHAFF